MRHADERAPSRLRAARARREQCGYTLFVLLLVVAVLVVLVGFVTPGDRRLLGEARAELSRLGQAARMRFADTAKLQNGFVWWHGPGATPPGLERRRTRPLSEFLTAPWLAERGLRPLVSDPWGRAYFVSPKALEAGRGVFVVSPGPDGVLQTAPATDEIRGDDIGYVIP